MNLPSGIRATPAGNEMKVLTTGRRRLKKAVAGPYFSKNRSASSISWGRIRKYLPQRSRNGRPPQAPIAYATSEPIVLPIVATVTTIQKLQVPRVSGSPGRGGGGR